MRYEPPAATVCEHREVIGIVIGGREVDATVTVEVRCNQLRWIFAAPRVLRDRMQSAVPVTGEHEKLLRVAAQSHVDIAISVEISSGNRLRAEAGWKRDMNRRRRIRTRLGSEVKEERGH